MDENRSRKFMTIHTAQWLIVRRNDRDCKVAYVHDRINGGKLLKHLQSTADQQGPTGRSMAQNSEKYEFTCKYIRITFY